LGLHGRKVLLIRCVQLICGEEEEAVRILASIVLTDEVVSASPWFMALFIGTVVRLMIHGRRLHYSHMVTTSRRGTVRGKRGMSDTTAEVTEPRLPPVEYLRPRTARFAGWCHV
jgi:hypothetical protein